MLVYGVSVVLLWVDRLKNMTRIGGRESGCYRAETGIHLRDPSDVVHDACENRA